MVMGILFIVFLLVAWVMAYFVFIHARINGRSVWLWGLIACIPVIGPILYIIYYNYKANRRGMTHRQSRLEQTGKYLLQPKTIGKILEYEAQNTLGKFRDTEVEKLVLDRKIDDARVKIAARQIDAASRRDPMALETYHLYIQLLERYSANDEVDPDVAELLGCPAQPEAEIGDGLWGVSDYDEITGYRDTGGYLVDAAAKPAAKQDAEGTAEEDPGAIEDDDDETDMSPDEFDRLLEL